MVRSLRYRLPRKLVELHVVEEGLPLVEGCRTPGALEGGGGLGEEGVGGWLVVVLGVGYGHVG